MVPSHTATLTRRPGLVSVAVAVCFLYGLLLIALIHTTADGSWFWYATNLRLGKHLYRDLHLPLQPLYAVEVAVLQRVLGLSWLAQQAVGLVNLLVFLASLATVTRYNRTQPWQRALLYTCAFVTCMGFIVMRFDDYHVLATSMQLLSAALLFRLTQKQTPAHHRLTLAALGLLSGMCLLIRINDGALLFAAVCIAGPFLTTSAGHRIADLISMPLTTALTVLIVLALLHESPRDWWFYSIHTAAAIKGGDGHLWLYPLRLPFGTLREFTRDWRFVTITAYVLLTGAIAAWLSQQRGRTAPRRRWFWLALAAIAAVPLWRNFVHGNVARVLVAITVLATYAVALATIVRLLRAKLGRPALGWQPVELLVLIPCGQLVSISLSAARWYPNTYPAAAVFLLLVPMAASWLFVHRAARAVFYTWVALLTLSVGIDKLRSPFDWFNYRAASLTGERTWYRHPVFGPMLVETSQRNLVLPVCQTVRTTQDASAREAPQLLSLPFTFANYFCDVSPWHGYVQTFYDTSSRATITALRAELASQPPEWIVYQRQLDVLRRNEEAFNNGRPLPHRELDGLIMARLAEGRWHARQLPSPAVDTSTWLLIHTR